MTNQSKYLIYAVVILNFAITATQIFAAPIEDMAFLLNQTRIENGKTSLQKSPDLTRIAQEHADDMAQNNYFSHTNLKGENHGDRIRKHGFEACLTAENIAQNAKTGAHAMSLWMSSKPHRQNNLNGELTHYGIGFASDMWVLIMAQRC